MSAALLWLAAAWTAAASAQVSISADVDRRQVPLNEQVTLSVTVTGSGASSSEPRLPPLPNFSVYSANRSQSFSIVNGQMSSSSEFDYVLIPHFVGKGVIGPISVTQNGMTVQTNPIQIEVGRPAAGQSATQAPPAAAAPAGRRQPGGTADIFVTAEVDKPRAYVNDQVTLSVKFYTSVSLLGNPQYNAPQASGFLAEDLPPERHGNVSMRGRNYYYSEIKTALFPAQPGRLTVGPAVVRCQFQSGMAVDPFSPDFFDKFFSQGLLQPQTREFSSEPLIVSAEPLPEAGKPNGFSGAVGHFTLSATLDRASAKVGDAVNLAVTVQGAGNLKAIGDPEMPALPDFRTFDTVSSISLDKRNDHVQGSKVLRTVLVPRVSGDLKVPPIGFSYFDPQRRAYERVVTAPLRLKVAPGEANAPGISFSAAGPAPQGVSAVSQDIRYLKIRTAAARPISRGLTALAEAGWINSVPAAVFLLAFGCAQYERLEALDPRRRRQRAALKSALRRVNQAEAEKDSRRSAAFMSEALTGYLADKLGQPALGLTIKRALEELRVQKPTLPDPLAERLRAVWQQLDARQFAPSGLDGAAGAADLRTLLESLEKELGR